MRRLSRRHVRLPALALSAFLLITAGWVRLGPLPAGLLDPTTARSVIVTDRHGEPLYEVRTANGLRGDWLDTDRVPDLLARATLAAEDERFYRHPGIDPIAIVRAAWRNVRAGAIDEGGSTISQQVVKLLLAQLNGQPARGWRAKAYEALLALRLEHRLPKRDILALYLNLAPYGNQIQGAARASRAYFGRDVSSLTAAEAAFLAALPQQPSRFNPWRNSNRATGRQHRILATMRSRGWLSADDLTIARAERLALTREQQAFLAPHFVERVMETPAAAGAQRVRTTLDAALLRTVQGIIGAQRAALDRHHAYNVAVVVLDNHRSEWLAWEGSGNYFDESNGGAIDGAVSPRQPGSALKPFTYAAAFERGWHPASVLADVPSQFPTAVEGVAYSPRNYDGRFRGPMRARVALAGSANVPAATLASEIGVPAVARMLRRAGLSTLEQGAAHYGVGLTLGNAEVRLDELVAAYASFARGGEWESTRSIISVDDRGAESSGARERIMSERTAFWITDILSDPDARAYAFGRGGSLDFPFAVAAKTGTSQSYVDNWVVGYTRDVTVGVWVGNFDRTPMRGSSGITGAGPIFHAVMTAAVERARGMAASSPERILPPTADVEAREVCALSGMVAGATCPTRAVEWLPRTAEPHTCSWHHASDRGLVTVWPEEYHEWARDNGIQISPGQSHVVANTQTGPAATRVRSDRQVSGLTIVRPLPGAVFMLDPTLRSEFQALTFAARGGVRPLRWSVNGREIPAGTTGQSARWPLVRGQHEVVVRDATGATATARIEVR